MQNKSVGQSVKILCQVSILIALAVMLRALPIPILPIFGRVNFSSIFSQLIPILFNPLLGMISGAIIDILGFFLRGGGVFMPHFTVLAIISALLVGILWRIIKINNRFIKLAIVILITDTIYTGLNLLGLILFAPHFLADGAETVFWTAYVVRLIPTLAFSIIKINVMFVLLTIYEKYIKKEKL
ncbi:MAG: ECF transporter S component [Oscillospiraceae bacterium]|nr:ECF transporter S component [Oscillospiraceae bacterium]